MTISKGWNWEEANHSSWLKPTEDSYYLANKWTEKGYKKILDLGTGLGRHAVYFAKQGFEVDAIDISDYAVEHLNAWKNQENLSINVSSGDMLNLPYADDTFDCIFAYHVIAHSDTQGVRKILSEIERVLKSGGEIFVSFSSKDSTDYSNEFDKRIDENTIICRKEPEVGVPHFYANRSDLISLLHNFSIEKMRHTEYCSLDLHDTRICRYYYISAVLDSRSL